MIHLLSSWSPPSPTSTRAASAQISLLATKREWSADELSAFICRLPLPLALQLLLAVNGSSSFASSGSSSSGGGSSSSGGGLLRELRSVLLAGLMDWHGRWGVLGQLKGLYEQTNRQYSLSNFLGVMFDLFDCQALQLLPVTAGAAAAAAAAAGGEEAEAVAMMELVTAPAEVAAATAAGCSTFAAAVLSVFGSMRTGMRRTLPRDPPTYAATAADVLQVHHTSSSNSIGTSSSSGGEGDWATVLAEVLCLVEVLAPAADSKELARKVAVSLTSITSSSSSGGNDGGRVVDVGPLSKVVEALPAAAAATVGKGEELWGELLQEIVEAVAAVMQQQQQQPPPPAVAQATATAAAAAASHESRAEHAMLRAAASGAASGAGHAQRAQQAILAAAASGPPATTPHAQKAVAALLSSAATAPVTPPHEKAAAAIAKAMAGGSPAAVTGGEALSQASKALEALARAYVGGEGADATATGSTNIHSGKAAAAIAKAIATGTTATAGVHTKKAVAALRRAHATGGDSAATATAAAESALLKAAAGGGVGSGDKEKDDGAEGVGGTSWSDSSNSSSGYYSKYHRRRAMVAEALSAVQAAAVAVAGDDDATAASANAAAAAGCSAGSLAAAGDLLIAVANQLDMKGGEALPMLQRAVQGAQSAMQYSLVHATADEEEQGGFRVSLLLMLPQLLLPRALYVAALTLVLLPVRGVGTIAVTAVQWEAAVAAVAEKQVPQGQLMTFLFDLVQQLQQQQQWDRRRDRMVARRLLGTSFAHLAAPGLLVRGFAGVLAAVAAEKLQPLFSSKEEAVARLLYLMLTGKVAVAANTAEAAAAESTSSYSSSTTLRYALTGREAAQLLQLIAQQQQAWLTATAARYVFEFHHKLQQSRSRGNEFFKVVALAICKMPLQPQLQLLLLLTPREGGLPDLYLRFNDPRPRQVAVAAAVAAAAGGEEGVAGLGKELAYLCNECNIGRQWPLAWYAQLLSEMLEHFKANSSSRSSYWYVEPLWAVVRVLGPMRGMRVVQGVPGGVKTLLPLVDLAEVLCYCQELMPRDVAEGLQKAVAGVLPVGKLEELLVLLPNAARAAFGKGEQGLLVHVTAS